MTGAAVVAVLLAGGESRRMGSQKALLPWQGRPLLEYQLAQLASVAEVTEIIVVTGDRADALAPIIAAARKARAVHNPAHAAGKSGSTRAGLAQVSDSATAILLTAVDQPRPAAIIRRLVREHLASGSPITVPLWQGRRGHPVLFDRTLLPELLVIEEATEGVRAVLQRDRGRVREVAFDDPVVLADLNTPEDVARWQRAAGAGRGGSAGGRD